MPTRVIGQVSPVLLHDAGGKVTLKTFFDQAGNVTKEIGSGPLFVELANLASGESLVTNISGARCADVRHGATLKSGGTWLFFFPGDLGPGHLGLLWLTTGKWVWRFTEEGGALIESHGRFEDVCQLLA